MRSRVQFSVSLHRKAWHEVPGIFVLQNLELRSKGSVKQKCP